MAADDNGPSDFDKSGTGERIDFHEAQRLSVEWFEKTYPEFCEFFNQNIRLCISDGMWGTRLTDKFTDSGWTFLNVDSSGADFRPYFGDGIVPKRGEVKSFVIKLGFDCSGNNPLTITWSRRDGRKYP